MDIITIYLICLGVGLVFAAVSAFLADGGGGHEAHADTHAHHAECGPGATGMPGFSPLSPTTIATFVTAFGGFGLILSKIEMTRSAWLSVPLAALGGLAVAALVVVVFNKIFRATQSSSEGRVAELFGTSATVITSIAAGGVGKSFSCKGAPPYPARARDKKKKPHGAPRGRPPPPRPPFFFTQ